MKRYPVGSDNWGWHLHYVKVFNKTQSEDSAHLAMFYLLNHLNNLKDFPCV